MSKQRLHKQKRQQRIEWLIQRELAKAEMILDQNTEAMRVLSRQIDSEPKGLAKVFAEIDQKGKSK
jgi:hypothetical protein